MSQLDKEIGERLTLLIKKLDEKAKTRNDGSKMNKGIFALLIDVDPSQFSRIIKGDAGLSIQSLLDISSKFNVNLSWILNGEEPVFKEKSGVFRRPDPQLLTQMMNDLDTLKKNAERLSISLHTLSASAEVPNEENVNQGAAYSGFEQDKNRKADTRSDT